MMRVLLPIIFIAISGCGKMYSQKRDFSSGGPANLLSVAKTKVVAVISKHQLLPNYQRCLNKLPSSAITDNTRSALNDALPSLAAEGESSEISAPMLMAITQVASEVCEDLVDFENDQANRKYFANFDLANTDSSASASADQAVSTTIRTLTSSCWGRDATAEEVAKIQNGLQKTSLNNKLNRSSALFVCTAVLSASAAIKF